MIPPDRARDNAAKALLRIFDSEPSPFSEQERALHAMDAICYYVSVMYRLPINKGEPTSHPVYGHAGGKADPLPDAMLIQEIRDTVDQDVTDPADWYKIILTIRELVGVTR